MSRLSVSALLVLLPACARTPPPALPGKPPGPERDALREAAFRDLRCPDRLPAVTPTKPRPPAIESVALVGQTAYGRSDAGVLWIWDGKDPARVFAPGRFVALARDGSVAVTSAPEGEHGTRLDAWALPSNQKLDSVLLTDGGVPIALSSGRAILRVAVPPIRCDGEFRDDLCEGDIAWQPPTSELAQWAFPSGATAHEPLEDCKQASLSARGRSFACLDNGEDVVSWEDRDGTNRSYVVRVAPEWEPPPAPQNENLPLHRQIEEHWLRINSLRLSPTDDAIYVSYRAMNIYVAERGLAGHRGWRLERWTVDPTRPHEGRFSRLAESPESLCTQVLAASRDGSLIVLGGSPARAHRAARAAVRARAAGRRARRRRRDVGRRHAHSDRTRGRPAAPLGRAICSRSWRRRRPTSLEYP